MSKKVNFLKWYLLVLWVFCIYFNSNAQIDSSSKNGINVEKTNTALIVTQNGKPILTYQIADTLPEGENDHYKRSGFIHPLYSPTGQILTDGFPADHMHQHGLFFAFVNTYFKGEKIDFWNQQKELGTVEFSKLIHYEGGSDFGKFETEQNHISLKNGIILKEKWDVKIYNSNPYRIEIHTTLKNITTDTLYIKEYKYGGMAFRGAKEWNESDSLHFQNGPNFHTNEGADRIAANHSRPLWSALSGKINGDQAGVVLLGHPTNFRHPEPIRIHPEMPYYCIAPMVGESFYIAPNESFEGTYTIVSYAGELPVDYLDELVRKLGE